jgi:MoaA/NifB/PqqE/SkfB family radical SAM enzyme
VNVAARIARHARITWQNYRPEPSPPFLILFINSICNQKCDHCFYWRNLNRKDDLSKEELFELSRQLGRIENLNLSGGEPFLRPEFGEICRQFIQRNKVRQIYVPTNGYFTDRTVQQVTETLKEKDLELFVAELSLDGLGEFHNKFRGSPGSFDKAMQTYAALAKIQETDPRLRIHAISTATDVNMDEIRRLTTFLFDKCPKMDHHNLAIIRGDRKNPSLNGPKLAEYQQLYDYVRRLWVTRETGRYGAVVEPMLQWAKTRTAETQTQFIPCRAGKLTAVVYSNGDVSVCETHAPIGNLRDQSFGDIWHSEKANTLRNAIARKECYCTNEVFLWPSVVYQPTKLVQVMAGAEVWKRTGTLAPGEKVDVTYVPAPARSKTAAAEVSNPVVSISEAATNIQGPLRVVE